MAKKPDTFQRDEDGKIIAGEPIRGWDTYYQAAVISYLNLWEELFEKAQEKNDFEFISALIRMRGMEDAGWDTFENTIEGIAGAYKAAKVLHGEQRLNIMLWAYGQVVEASDHYEIIANMVNIAGSEPYRAWNFPKKKAPTKKNPSAMRAQTPNEKILVIRALCKKFDLPDYSAPFSEVLDKELRNAIYHSDYSVYEGMVRIREGKVGFPVEYSQDETRKLLNEALALHEVIKKLYEGYIASYTEPKIIDVPLSFSHGQQMKAQVIVRENHGVIAMQEHPQKPGSWSFGRYVLGEQEKIRQGVFNLPESASVRINSVLDRISKYKARRWGKFIRTFHYNRGADMTDQVISVKEARKILGKEAVNLSDKELVKLIDDLDYIAKHLIRQYKDKNSSTV
jgi:hypothetical protein